jgi:hypothetical protein
MGDDEEKGCMDEHDLAARRLATAEFIQAGEQLITLLHAWDPESAHGDLFQAAYDRLVAERRAAFLRCKTLEGVPPHIAALQWREQWHVVVARAGDTTTPLTSDEADALHRWRAEQEAAHAATRRRIAALRAVIIGGADEPRRTAIEEDERHE